MCSRHVAEHPQHTVRVRWNLLPEEQRRDRSARLPVHSGQRVNGWRTTSGCTGCPFSEVKDPTCVLVVGLEERPLGSRPGPPRGEGRDDDRI